MGSGGFWILHFEKAKVAHLPEVSSFEEAFCLDTCQRRAWIFTEQDPSILRGSSGENRFEGQVLQNQEAYAQLLRILTGLESRIVGETDVFGQFKTAWNAYLAKRPDLAKLYSPLMRNLFEDVKDIRSKFLQNIGGNSYGTLVRKLLKEKGMQADQPVMIVGAGQMAESVAPYLKDQALFVYNRSVERTTKFLDYLNVKRKSAAQAVSLDKVKETRFVVMAIPAGTELDAEIFKNLPADATLVHLGSMDGQQSAFKDHAHFFTLKELFGTQGDMGSAREAKIDSARRACAERALHRSLGTHLSVPHGWEDLALFA